MVKSGSAAVDETIHGLCRGAAGVLGDQYFGMYLYGSLATGGFSLERSDIDFLIVTRTDLSQSIIDNLQRFHEHQFRRSEHWTGMLEGCYLPLASLRKYVPNEEPRPTVHKRRFFLGAPGYDWVLQRSVLLRYPTIVDGPSLAPYIDLVDRAQIIEAISHILEDWWVPILRDRTRIEEPDYAAYAVLTMCRALCGMVLGSVVSKAAAAEWALRNIDATWQGLIAQARAWTCGSRALNAASVLEFIAFTITSSLPPAHKGL